MQVKIINQCNYISATLKQYTFFGHLKKMFAKNAV